MKSVIITLSIIVFTSCSSTGQNIYPDSAARFPATKQSSNKSCSLLTSKLLNARSNITPYFSKFSDSLTPVSDQIERFISEHVDGIPAIKLRPDQIEISNNAIIPYIQSVGKNTIEVLHVASSYGYTGHLALRVGSNVFHVDTKKGIIKQSLQHIVTNRYKNHRIFGYTLQASPREIEKIKLYFRAKMSDEQPSFDLIFNNCSQNVCRALRTSEIHNYSTIVALDPSFVSFFTAMNKRVVIKTVYNTNKDTSVMRLVVGKLFKRSIMYSLPFLGVVQILSLTLQLGDDTITGYMTSRALETELDDYDDPLDFAKDIAYVSDYIIMKVPRYNMLSYLKKQILNRPNILKMFETLRVPIEILETYLKMADHLYDSNHPNRTKIVRKLLGQVILQDLTSTKT